MKGMVFTTFADWVEETYGLALWDEMLTELNPESGGAYTSGETYPDAELFDYLGYLVEKTEADLGVLVESFGIFMLPRLLQAYPIFVKPGMTLKEFLKTIDDVIHVEVKKLHPDAILPKMHYEELDEKTLTINYESPRNLCILAIGLMRGAADYFEEPIQIDHFCCMTHNTPSCQFVINFE